MAEQSLGQESDTNDQQLPPFPTQCVDRFSSGDHPELLKINEQLDAMQDYHSGTSAEFGGSSGYLIVRAKRFSDWGQEDLAIKTLDLGARWHRTQIHGACYQNVAMSAIAWRDPTKLQLAYQLALSEERMTSANGYIKTIPRMLEAERPDRKVADTVGVWLEQSSLIHAAAITSAQHSELASKYIESAGQYVDLLAYLGTRSARLDESLTETYANFVVAGETRLQNALLQLQPDLQARAIPKIAKNVRVLLDIMASKARERQPAEPASENNGAEASTRGAVQTPPDEHRQRITAQVARFLHVIDR